MRTSVLAMVLLLPALAALAQPPAGSIRITVVDPSGAVIVGAQVTVRPDGRERAGAPLVAGTSGRGDAVFAELEPGRYWVHVEAAGFEPSDLRDLRLRTGETHRQVKLAIAKLSEM